MATTRVRVDVVILMDATASMGSYIRAAAQGVVQTVERFLKRFPGADVRMAAIAYRDFCERPTDRLIVVPLTHNLERVRSAIASWVAFGGNDDAEDVAGGLSAVLALGWSADVRLLVHAADSPAHGRAYHDIAVSDEYPHGDPEGRDPAALAVRLAELGVDYYFMRLTSTTDIMIRALDAAYTRRTTELQRHHTQVFTVIDLKAQGVTESAPPVPSASHLFNGEAAPESSGLDAAYVDALTESLTSSASRRATRPSVASRLYHWHTAYGVPVAPKLSPGRLARGLCLVPSAASMVNASDSLAYNPGLVESPVSE